MHDFPSANTSRAMHTTLQTGETENDWQLEWLTLSDVMGRFHVARVGSLLEVALANYSAVGELSHTDAHAAMNEFFDSATALVARSRQSRTTEISPASTGETNAPAEQNSCGEWLLCLWPDPFEFVICQSTPDRRARCFLSQPTGRLLSRSIRLLDLALLPPLATTPIAGDATILAANPPSRTSEMLDALLPSMRWPDDAVTEAQLSALSLTRRSKRLPGISALLQQLQDDDLAHDRPTTHQTSGSAQHEGDGIDIDEIDLSECLVAAEGKYVARPRHMPSASTRFKQSVEKVEYGLDRYVARLLRDRFARELRRAATLHGHFHLDAAQWIVCAPRPAACAFRANALVAERGWLTGVARHWVAGENLPPWILPVLDVVDVRGPVRAAFGSALVTEMRRLRKPLAPPVCTLRPALSRYLASSACGSLSVGLIPALCLALAPHAPELWPVEQNRLRRLAEAEHIRSHWQTALLTEAARSSATRAALRNVRHILMKAGSEETKMRLRGMTALTIGDCVDQIRNPIAHAWQSHGSSAEGSEIPWVALFVRWLEAVATLVAKDTQRSVREARILALSASSVRTLRRALTSLSARTNLSGLLVADLSNDSMPDYLYQLLNVLARRFRAIDRFDVPEDGTGFVFPRFLEPSTFEISFDGVVYRAEVLTELRRIREIGDLMENCLSRLHSALHMLTRGDVLIAWFKASAPNLPLGVVELEPIADPHGLPLIAPSFLAAQWPLRWSISEALGPKNSQLSDEQRAVAVAIAQRFHYLVTKAVCSTSVVPMQSQGGAKAHRWGVLFDSIARTVEASDMLDRLLFGMTEQGIVSYPDVATEDEERGEIVMPTPAIDAELLAALQRFRLCRSFEIATSGF